MLFKKKIFFSFWQFFFFFFLVSHHNYPKEWIVVVFLTIFFSFFFSLWTRLNASMGCIHLTLYYAQYKPMPIFEKNSWKLVKIHRNSSSKFHKFSSRFLWTFTIFSDFHESENIRKKISFRKFPMKFLTKT